jgi:hypothetical protein
VIPEHLVDSVPLWGVFVATVVITLVSIRAGFRAGAHRRQRTEGEPEGPVGSVVGAMLGLLAFILAFTFGTASSRFDTRKHLVLEEVNAFETAYLRAALLPEPQRTESRRLLRRYVEIRTEIARDPSTLGQGVAESEALQAQLWSGAAALARSDLNSDIGALYIESLNHVIDLHTARVTVALQYRVPMTVRIALLLVAVLAMTGVGYQFGVAGRGGFLIHLVLALSFSAVVYVIADLDWPLQGLLKVSQQPMLELRERLDRPYP